MLAGEKAMFAMVTVLDAGGVLLLLLLLLLEQEINMIEDSKIELIKLAILLFIFLFLKL